MEQLQGLEHLQVFLRKGGIGFQPVLPFREIRQSGNLSHPFVEISGRCDNCCATLSAQKMNFVTMVYL